jgi:hypothetical protein
LFSFAGEAKGLFVDSVPVEVGKSAIVLRIREAGENGCGAEVAVGGRKGSDQTKENDCGGQFAFVSSHLGEQRF